LTTVALRGSLASAEGAGNATSGLGMRGMSEILWFDASRLVQETVEDAVLVIDVSAGCCFALDGGAAALWPSLMQGASRDTLLRFAEAAFDAPAHEVRPAVESFLDALLAAGVLVPVAGVGRLQAPGARLPFEPPRMKRYDDLEALLGEGED